LEIACRAKGSQGGPRLPQVFFLKVIISKRAIKIKGSLDLNFKTRLAVKSDIMGKLQEMGYK
jgi:hypothetical protein